MSVLTAGKTSALLASMAMAAVLSRLLQRADYGAFSQIITIHALCSIVFPVGIPQSIYYFLPRCRPAEKRAFALQSALLMGLQGSVASMVMYLAAPALGRAWSSPILPELLRAFAPYPMLVLPVMAMESVLASEGRAATIAAFNGVAKAAAFVAVVLPVWCGEPLRVAIRWWIGIASIECLFAIGLILLSLPPSTRRLRPQFLAEQYRFAVPLAVASALGALGYYADRLSVSFLSTPERFAVYSNGAFELPVVGVVAVAVTMSLSPSMVQHAREGSLESILPLWHRAQAKVALVLFPLFGGLIFFAPEAIAVVFGPKYAESAVIFRLFLLLIPCRVSSFQALVVPLGITGPYARAHLLYVGIAATLCPALYSLAGLKGAAVGAVIAVYVVTGIVGYQVSKALGTGWRQMWAFRPLSEIAVMAIAGGALAWGALAGVEATSTQGQWVRLGLGAAITGVTFLAVARHFRVAGVADLETRFRRRLTETRTRRSQTNRGGTRGD